MTQIILHLNFCFWDAVICAIKAKYETDKINVIKGKYES